jgi:hypothetical protein
MVLDVSPVLRLTNLFINKSTSFLIFLIFYKVKTKQPLHIILLLKLINLFINLSSCFES